MPLRFRILQGQPPSAGAQVADAVGWGTAPAIERLVEMADLEEIRIGRRAGLDITLPFPTISALHTVIRRPGKEHRWTIEDRGSTNGSWVATERLQPGAPRPLLPGQNFRVGEVEIVFDGWVEDAKAAEGTASLARRLVADLFTALSGGEIPKLVVRSGPLGIGPLMLVDREKSYLVGRAETCALQLPLESVSREHAAFARRWDGIWVRDMGSTNGVLIHGVPARIETHLRDGDQVQIGDVTLLLDDPEDRYLRKMESSEGVPAQSVATARAELVSSRTPPLGGRAADKTTASGASPFAPERRASATTTTAGGVSRRRHTSAPRRAIAWGAPSPRTTLLTWGLGGLIAIAIAGAAWILFVR
jgi:pSer/pThr/pTyr-binding forkhead associated (FHA) protein